MLNSLHLSLTPQMFSKGTSGILHCLETCQLMLLLAHEPLVAFLVSKKCHYIFQG